jgi:hypothetical protein
MRMNPGTTGERLSAKPPPARASAAIIVTAM